MGVSTDVTWINEIKKLWKEKIKKGMCTVQGWHLENVNVVKVIYSYKF